jgi:hypothetical protein
VDSDERRRTICSPRKPTPQQKGPNCPFTTAAVSARLELKKGRIRCRSRYGGPQGYAVSSLAPGPWPHRSPNDAR